MNKPTVTRDDMRVEVNAIERKTDELRKRMCDLINDTYSLIDLLKTKNDFFCRKGLGLHPVSSMLSDDWYLEVIDALLEAVQTIDETYDFGQDDEEFDDDDNDYWSYECPCDLTGFCAGTGCRNYFKCKG